MEIEIAKQRLTPMRQRLIDDAIDAGYTVKEKNGRWQIFRGRQYKHKLVVSTGIEMWPDGSANRIDIPLSQTVNIRTIKSMRRILGLSMKGRK